MGPCPRPEGLTCKNLDKRRMKRIDEVLEAIQAQAVEKAIRGGADPGALSELCVDVRP